jgi:hypothetical protein
LLSGFFFGGDLAVWFLQTYASSKTNSKKSGMRASYGLAYLNLIWNEYDDTGHWIVGGAQGEL